MIKVLLDTNILALMLQERIDIFEELSNLLEERFLPLVLLENVEETLRKINLGRPSERGLFRRVLHIVGEKVIIVNSGIEEGLKTDDKIILYALNEGCYVATNDKALRRRLRRLGLPVIFYREAKKSFLIE
ncbi:MAG: nucleotide-binding protein [Thermoprotei archaeon]|nr:MAG: nucleotide-binding protein [Thermoprotei archaeon]RLF02770.1 MAG: nucleotide-binding protein [Thermoprotei archaeon]